MRTGASRRAPARLVFALVVLLSFALVSGPAVSHAAGTVLLGDQVVETAGDSNPAGVAEAFQTTATASGSVATLSVYVDTGSTASRLVAGVYTNASGHPGSLLTQGTLNAPVAGSWNDIPVTSVPIASGTTYWIALLGPAGTLRFRDRCCGKGTAAETASTTGLTTLPGSWTTGSAYRDGPFSAYGSAAAAPVLVVSPASLAFTASVGGADPPAQTIGISNGGTGTLSWSASPGASWLSVSPASGTGPATAAVSPDITGLSAGSYAATLTVSAPGAQGTPQTVAVSLDVTAPDNQAPTAPSGLTAAASGNTASLSWTAAQDNVGVTRYDVYRSQTPGFTPGAGNQVGQTASTAFTDTNLAAGTYHYLVAAEDAAGNLSGPSNEAAATIAQQPPATFLVGDQTIEARTDQNSAGVAEAFRSVAAAAGTLSTLKVFVDPGSTATKLTAGIYADNGGHPGSLLAQGTITSPSAGNWNDVSVPPVPITSGTAYWIAVLGPSGSGTLKFRERGGAGTAEVSGAGGLATLAQTWTPGPQYNDGPLSAWGAGLGPAGPPPDQVGQWSAPVSWPLVAVHMILQPTGNVLAIDAWSDAPNTQRVWNPANGSFVAVPYAANLFCSGHILLPDGRTLVVGGNVAADIGIKDATLFNSQTNTWSKAADMSVPRWYPTATVMGDGRVFVFGGDNIVDQGLPYSPSYLKEASQNSLPSIYDPATNTWTDLTGSRLTTPLYPFLFQLSDGRIFDAGPDVTSRVMTPGSWTWSTVATSPFDGGSAVMYLPDKIMKAGSYGNPDYYGANTYQATARTAVIDMGQPNPQWRETAPMSYARTYQNMTMLPDGTVLASGGMSTSDGVDLTKAVLPAEIWNPATETWKTVASLTVGREYHSTALLLPDGRVLMAGGGQLPGRATNITSAEIYSPPYLFKGARPAISSAPSVVSYGASFAVTTPDAASIQKVALVRTPSVTHAFDENQRYIPLSFTAGSGQLTVQAPASSDTAPPGYYMLYILNGNGVPSVASFVRFPTPSEDTQPPSAPTALTATSGSGGTVSLAWPPSTDDTGVARYDVYRSQTSGFTPSLANRVAQPAGTTYQDTGLGSGTYYYVVKAEDAAGNLSGPSPQASATVGTADTTPPTVSVTAPASGATLAGAVTVTAAAGDDVGVAGVRFTLDGQTLGSEDTAAPYSVSWDTTTAANGSHTLSAVARDAAGNTTTATAVPVTVQNTAPPPLTYLFGDQTIEAANDSNTAGVAEAFTTTAATAGTVRKLTVYVASGSTAATLVAGLYADAGGHPGALLATGSLTSPAAGAWNDVPVPAVPVSAGTRYWIALLGPNGGGVLRFRDRCCTTGGAETAQQTGLAALPATWVTGHRYNDAPMSGYASGTVP